MATTTSADLRHFTSIPNLAASHRLSQHLRTSPARSPTSIPSSPTSVHSSSSAIFERDIEPLSPPSPQPHHHSHHHHHHHHHHPDPHRIPRSRTTEQIEHSVPSVLDSAAAILASMQGPTDVSVVAPAPYAGSPFPSSGFASPIGSFGSRSPSPTAIHGRNSSLLLSIPQQQHQHQTQGSLSGSPPRQSSMVRPAPTIQTTNVALAPPASTAAPSIITPTSAYFTVADDSESHSVSGLSDAVDLTATIPPTRDHHHPTQHPTSSPSSPSSSPAAAKRLSFLSYADLLTSTPTSTLPLASLTTAASAIEPPPHIIGVTSYPYPASPATSLRGFVVGPVSIPHLHHSNSNNATDPFAPLVPVAPIPIPTRKDSGLVPVLDDFAVGEWEREGLGKGLEERLDVLYGTA